MFRGNQNHWMGMGYGQTEESTTSAKVQENVEEVKKSSITNAKISTVSSKPVSFIEIMEEFVPRKGSNVSISGEKVASFPHTNSILIYTAQHEDLDKDDMIEFTILLTKLDTKLKKPCEECQCICHPVDESIDQTVRQCRCLEKRIQKLEEMKRALEESQKRKCPEECPCPCDTHVEVSEFPIATTSVKSQQSKTKSLGAIEEEDADEAEEVVENEARHTSVSEMRKFIDEDRESISSRNPSMKYTEERTSDGFYRKISNVLRLNKKK